MNDRFSKYMALTVGAILAVGLPLLAQEEQEPQAPPQQQQQQQQQQMAGPADEGAVEESRVRVTAASRLLGHQVLSQDDRNVGTIEYLTLDIENGSIQYALVASETGTPGELIAIPWEAFQVSSPYAHRLALKVDERRVSNAPRIEEGRISELTDPRMVTQIHDYYLVPEERTEQGTSSGEQREPRQEGAEPRRESPQQQSQQQEQQQEQQLESPAARSQEEGIDLPPGHPAVLVGRELVTVLVPSDLATLDQLTGSTVVSPDGERVGDLDQLMIDTDRGRVAYALIRQGDYLGVGGEWSAVPFELLTWNAEQQRFQLESALSETGRMERLPTSELPSVVRRADLQRLYDDYGVTPYWEEAATE